MTPGPWHRRDRGGTLTTVFFRSKIPESFRRRPDPRRLPQRVPPTTVPAATMPRNWRPLVTVLGNLFPSSMRVGQNKLERLSVAVVF
jgi:hypothetical protein